MTKTALTTVIGMMSGTSLDGVDIALIKTDGQSIVERVAFATYEYDDAVREAVRTCFGLSSDPDGRVKHAEKLITDAHIKAVKDFGHTADLIGFHGQTIFHDPANRMTWQIGDGQALADATGMDVVYDFRTADVQAGGQGAPLIPLYHQVLARSAKLPFPCAVVNIGGVANITWIGAEDNQVIAFDTGSGNALVDDWMLHHAQQKFDAHGKTALSGQVKEGILQQLLSHEFFTLPVPKSLDRDAFSSKPVAGLSVADGAATLSAFTVDAILRALDHVPQPPQVLYVTGGGRKNNFMMKRLMTRLDGIPVAPVDALGWNGDAMEAEGFGYLALRSKLGLPLSLPTTTNCPMPMTGGKFVKANG